MSSEATQRVMASIAADVPSEPGVCEVFVGCVRALGELAKRDQAARTLNDLWLCGPLPKQITGAFADVYVRNDGRSQTGEQRAPLIPGLVAQVTG